ncbi:low molecular weight phosphotyrosine protein phosphatase [Aliishimia ponticola]|uniref:protein-tyrosine-phosphatase n=1 Tax=Aliishimia ponticola TaxID=2499833 RepID=A0A4S4NA47_9RHOB|nr:low molecular weight protein-tyrosine-phosphatase [Aliishimia ponticola]THH36154.1 low molecular weight phosphotyrosine protein phosphatase [Aliishimia ponticola]
MNVLFVCLGNICRSPLAEAAFRQQCPDISCDSAGTSDWHVGEPPYAPMQTAARARGLDLSDLRARQFTRDDFTRFTHIFAMDENNLMQIEALRPAGNTTPVRLFAPYARDGLTDVPDPYYTRDFEEVLDLVDRAVRSLAIAMRA